MTLNIQLVHLLITAAGLALAIWASVRGALRRSVMSVVHQTMKQHLTDDHGALRQEFTDAVREERTLREATFAAVMDKLDRVHKRVDEIYLEFARRRQD